MIGLQPSNPTSPPLQPPHIDNPQKRTDDNKELTRNSGIREAVTPAEDKRVHEGRGGGAEEAADEIVGGHGGGRGGVVEIYEEDVHDVVGRCYEEGDGEDEDEDDGEGRVEGEEEGVGEDCSGCEDLDYIIVNCIFVSSYS